MIPKEMQQRLAGELRKLADEIERSETEILEWTETPHSAKVPDLPASHARFEDTGHRTLVLETKHIATNRAFQRAREHQDC